MSSDFTERWPLILDFTELKLGECEPQTDNLWSPLSLLLAFIFINKALATDACLTLTYERQTKQTKHKNAQYNKTNADGMGGG